MDTLDLAENGREVLAWRVVNDVSEFVVVELGFTIAGLEHEDFASFRERMLKFSATLAMLGHPVTGLIFQRRRAQNKRHWAEFTCSTPMTFLPAPVIVSTGEIERVEIEQAN